ncbi:MAG: tetratricopeptide repeat protein [Candidatus Aminicenantales bacterium]
MRPRLIFILVLCLSFIVCVSPGKKSEYRREKDPNYLYNLGLYHLNAGNIDEAIRYLERVISLKPDYFLALNALGLASYLRGNWVEAEKYFKKCLEINPGFTEARTNLGTVYVEMGLLEKAREEYLTALKDKNYPSKELPYYNLAKMSLSTGHVQRALDYIQKAIAENRAFAAAHNLEGLILEKLGKLLQAIKSYEEAVKIVPSALDFNYNLAVALFKARNYRRAGEIFKKILPALKDEDLKEKVKNYLSLIEKKKEPPSNGF